MARLCIFFFPMFGSATVFPDVLVPVLGQPKFPSDLIGTTMHVPSRRELDNHLSLLGANPSFTKHMEVFQGAETMARVRSRLRSEIGLAMSTDELVRCAQEPSCLEVWTTADALTGKTVRITQILGSWSMSEMGVGNVCHVKADHNVAFCHVPFDAYKSGLSWLAMGVPVDMPLQKPLPVAVRCHDMGPSSHDAPCHVLSGNEFMAARTDHINTYVQSGVSQIPATASNATVVSLGWHPPIEGSDGTLVGGSMCLDLHACYPGAPVQMWSCNGLSNQYWDSTLFDPDEPSEGFIRFIGSYPERCCLDVPGKNVADGQEMWVWDCNYGDSGQVFTWSGNGQLRLGANFNYCLEWTYIEGGHPFLAFCSDSETQVWGVTPGNEFMAARTDHINTHVQFGVSQIPAIASNATVVSLGWWNPPQESVVTLVGGSMCLDLAGGACASGAPVQMWSCNGLSNQIWESTLFDPEQPTEGFIRFRGGNIPTRCCLDVPGGNAADGQELWVWECDYGSSNQVFSWSGNGQLRLGANFDYCLEWSYSEGGHPFLAFCSDSETQVWGAASTGGVTVV